MYMYGIYRVDIYSTGPYVPQMIYAYTILDEDVNPLTPRKYTIVNGNFVFDLHDFTGT
jgi:hypothetical protein